MLRRMLTLGLMLVALSTVIRGEDASSRDKATNPMFEKIKKLAGTWVEADEHGKPTDNVVSVVKVTAGGSAVQDQQATNSPFRGT